MILTDLLLGRTEPLFGERGVVKIKKKGLVGQQYLDIRRREWKKCTDIPNKQWYYSGYVLKFVNGELQLVTHLWNCAEFSLASLSSTINPKKVRYAGMTEIFLNTGVSLKQRG